MSSATYLVTVAGSAGAPESLMRLLAGFPTELPVAIAAALHTGPGSVLVDVLRRRSRLPVEWAISDMTLQPGHVYVAPAGRHLVVNPDARLTVSEAARIRLFRPSADWLFESAAASFGERHVAIVLSGMLSDGAVKLSRVKRSGGTVVVQAPPTCPYPDMPNAAISTGYVDVTLPVEAMGAYVQQLFAERERQADIAAWEDPFGHALLAS